jgi:hypothetical protein
VYGQLRAIVTGAGIKLVPDEWDGGRGYQSDPKPVPNTSLRARVRLSEPTADDSLDTPDVSLVLLDQDDCDVMNISITFDGTDWLLEASRVADCGRYLPPFVRLLPPCTIQGEEMTQEVIPQDHALAYTQLFANYYVRDLRSSTTL